MPRLQLALNEPLFVPCWAIRSFSRTLDGLKAKITDGEIWHPGWFSSFGTSWWSLGDGRQGYRTLPVVVHDVIQVFIFQVHFLGPTYLAQLGCPLPESLRVGPTAVAVDLGVSRVVLPRRTRLPGRPAGRDELWNTWSSVHRWWGAFSRLATRCPHSPGFVSRRKASHFRNGIQQRMYEQQTTKCWKEQRESPRRLFFTEAAVKSWIR